MVYLVTASHAYYPGSGAEDWISVHADEASARAAFDAAEPSKYIDVFLIVIDPPGWRVLAEKPEVLPFQL